MYANGSASTSDDDQPQHQLLNIQSDTVQVQVLAPMVTVRITVNAEIGLFWTLAGVSWDRLEWRQQRFRPGFLLTRAPSRVQRGQIQRQTGEACS